MRTDPLEKLEKVDFHVHTEYAAETVVCLGYHIDKSRGFTVKKICDVADQLGLEAIGITEHWSLETDLELFEQIREDVEACRDTHQVKVFISAEIDVLNSKGDLAVDPVKARDYLDYVSVGVFHYGERLFPDPFEDAVRMVKAVARIPEVDVILHPQIVVTPVLRQKLDDVPTDLFYDMMAEVAQQNKVVECTSYDLTRSSILMDIGEGREEQVTRIVECGFQDFIAAMVSSGARFTLGSDAHNEFYYRTWARWLGNVQATARMLRDAHVDEGKFWKGPLKAIDTEFGKL